MVDLAGYERIQEARERARAEPFAHATARGLVALPLPPPGRTGPALGGLLKGVYEDSPPRALVLPHLLDLLAAARVAVPADIVDNAQVARLAEPVGSALGV